MTNPERMHRRGCEDCEYTEVIVHHRPDAQTGEDEEIETACHCTLEEIDSVE